MFATTMQPALLKEPFQSLLTVEEFQPVRQPTLGWSIKSSSTHRNGNSSCRFLAKRLPFLSQNKKEKPILHEFVVYLSPKPLVEDFSPSNDVHCQFKLFFIT